MSLISPYWYRSDTSWSPMPAETSAAKVQSSCQVVPAGCSLSSSSIATRKSDLCWMAKAYVRRYPSAAPHTRSPSPPSLSFGSFEAAAPPAAAAAKMTLPKVKAGEVSR